MKTGVLVINLGTPDAPSPSKVRAYLRQFLSDPRVIDINPLGRWLLLNLFILPFRPRKSAAAYEKIWTADGSPLLLHTKAFAERLQAALPAESFRVEFAMRYGNPSIPARLDALLGQSVDRILLFPMYPQYASSSTGSSLACAFRHLAGRWNVPPVRVVPPFFQEAGFIDAIAALGRPHLGSLRPDHILFSYHGLPERQIRRSESLEGHCLKADDACCAAIGFKNQYCYRAQCFETTRRLAARLELAPGSYTTAFQSRLGRTPWIKPYADLAIQDLARQGKKRLLVFEPSFTADCLETLEEVGLRASASFLQGGGEKLVLVPSLNAEPAWVAAARDMVLRA
jgi:protoporphyrin/coproporphyrin ferrochelatase